MLLLLLKVKRKENAFRKITRTKLLRHSSKACVMHVIAACFNEKFQDFVGNIVKILFEFSIMCINFSGDDQNEHEREAEKVNGRAMHVTIPRKLIHLNR